MSNKNSKSKKRERSSSEDESNTGSSDNEKIVANHIDKKANKKPTTTTTTTNHHKVLGTLAVPNSGGNKNQKLTDILTELGVFEKNKGQIHKFSAYRKASQSIRAAPNEIKSGKEAEKLPGVGKKIALKIQEIIDTGGLRKLNTQLQDETMTAINEISKVSGIGPQAAKKFVEEGIKTIADLEKVKDRLTHHQQIGLKYHYEIEQRIPRIEIEQFEEIVRKSLLKIDKAIIYQTCGSYRRGLPTSGDIDVLLTHPKFTTEMKDKKQTFNIIENLVESLKKQGIIIEDLSLGKFKYMGIGKIPIQTSKQDNKKQGDDDEDSDCTTTKEGDDKYNNNDNEDNTSSGEEEFEEDDSSATEPEDNSKKQQPIKKKIIKKPITTTNKKQTTTTSTTSPATNNKPIARRIDFLLVPYSSYFAGLLHATGSDEFNRQLRAHCLVNGYTLSEYSLKKLIDGQPDDTPIVVNSEKEIFDIVGMKYYEPTERSL